MTENLMAPPIRFGVPDDSGCLRAVTDRNRRADFLHEILANLAGVVDAVPNAQRKHLLRLLVEKVLVRDRCTFEVWYKLPQFPAARTLSLMVAPKCQCTNRLRRVRQRLSARAVFLLNTGSADGPQSRTCAHVRVVGRGVRQGLDRLVRAPSARLIRLDHVQIHPW
jgi:hypothetical protein